MKILSLVVEHTTWLLCLLIGVCVPLISIPVAMLGASVPQDEPFIPPWEVFGSIIGAALIFSSGFMLFAGGWRGRMANLGYRCATSVLLLPPIAAGLALMSVGRGSSLSKELAIVLIAFAGWLLLLCWRPVLLRSRA